MTKEYKKVLDTFSNYNLYSMLPTCKRRPITEERIMQLIKDLRTQLDSPYVRLMSVSGEGDAKAVVYNADKHVTKLVDVTEIEEMVKSNAFASAKEPERSAETPPEYIIRDTNGAVLYHGHNLNYAWRKFNKIYNDRQFGILSDRKGCEGALAARHDGKEYSIAAMGRKSIGHGDYEVHLYLIAN